MFYDRNGNAVAYTEDNEHIYMFNGNPVAYFYNDKVYGFNGIHLGWFGNGWIRDLNGRCVLFNSKASGSGPIKPVKSIKPIKSVKSIKPVKGVKQVSRVRSVDSLSWSHLTGKDFLLQGI